MAGDKEAIGKFPSDEYGKLSQRGEPIKGHKKRASGGEALKVRE